MALRRNTNLVSQKYLSSHVRNYSNQNLCICVRPTTPVSSSEQWEHKTPVYPLVFHQLVHRTQLEPSYLFVNACTATAPICSEKERVTDFYPTLSSLTLTHQKIRPTSNGMALCLSSLVLRGIMSGAAVVKKMFLSLV